jgi:hypothetical protein
MVYFLLNCFLPFSFVFFASSQAYLTAFLCFISFPPLLLWMFIYCHIYTCEGNLSVQCFMEPDWVHYAKSQT